jgi:hypothetical protein
MIKGGWEAQPIADQVKVTWGCTNCGTVVEAFASIWNTDEARKELADMKAARSGKPL